MPAGDGVAAGENLRLHGAGEIHEIDAPASRGRGRSDGFSFRLFPLPAAKNSFDGAEDCAGIEVSDENEERVFRRIERVVGFAEIGALIRLNLIFRGRNLRVGMRAEENLAETLAGEKARLGAFELHFLEFLAALAFEFAVGEDGFAREFVDKLQQRFGEIAEAGEADGAGVLAGAGGKVGAEAAQIFLNAAAVALRGAGAHDSGGHFRERGAAIDDGGVAGAKKEFAVEFGDGARFGENDFHAIRQAGARAARPVDGAFGSERGNAFGGFSCLGGHYAASCAPALTGRRKTTARLAGWRNLAATD